MKTGMSAKQKAFEKENQMLRAKKRGERRNVSVEKLEAGWNDSHHISELPKYVAENDIYNPKARTRKFNNDQKKLTKKAQNKGKGASKWLDSALESTYEETPIKFTPSLREKASMLSTESSINLNMNSINGTISTTISENQQQLQQSQDDTNMAEVEILQKVIIRENLIEELRKLVLNQNDLGNILNEAIELVKAIRFQTVEIIEDIEAWKHVQKFPRGFLYRGQNYLIKIFYDMSFLDKYQMITDTFGFSFSNNPLLYNKLDQTSNRISLADKPFVFSTDEERADWGYVNSSLNASIDGVDVLRLKHTEKVIQQEMDRIEEEKLLIETQNKQQLLQQQQQSLQSSQSRMSLDGGQSLSVSFAGDLNNSMISTNTNNTNQKKNGLKKSMNSNNNNNNNNVTARLKDKLSQIQIPKGWKKKDNQTMNYKLTNKLHPEKRGTFGMQTKDVTTVSGGKPWNIKFNNIKVKRERISILSEEIEHLKAVRAHIEEQISAKVMEYHELRETVKTLERKRRLAISEARDAAAQHCSIELSIHSSDMQLINEAIKNLQRESYFIDLEKNRKKGIVKKLEDQIDTEKKQNILKKKLSSKIQKEGLLSAVKGLSALQRAAAPDMFESSESDKVLLRKWDAMRIMQDISSDEDNNNDDDDDDDDIQYQPPYSTGADTGDIDEENGDVNTNNNPNHANDRIDVVTGPAINVARSIRRA